MLSFQKPLRQEYKYKIKMTKKAEKKQPGIALNKCIVNFRLTQLGPRISVCNVGLGNPVIRNLALHKSLESLRSLKNLVLMSLLDIMLANAGKGIPSTSHKLPTTHHFIGSRGEL